MKETVIILSKKKFINQTNYAIELMMNIQQHKLIQLYLNQNDLKSSKRELVTVIRSLFVNL